MDRDRIKIIEFGDDGVSDSSEPRPAARAMGEKKIKILEFEGGPEQVRPEQTAEPAVGHIKIMEFDGGPGNEAPRRAETPTGAPSRATTRSAAAAMSLRSPTVTMPAAGSISASCSPPPSAPSCRPCTCPCGRADR